MTTEAAPELKMPSYGGQAVIEGVMMRGKKAVAMAVRSPQGEIVLFEEQLPAVYRSVWFRTPFVRGVLGLWDSLELGMRYLTKAANVQTGEDEKIEGGTLVLTVLLAVALGVGIFFLLPALAAGWVDKSLSLGSWWSNLFEGFLRLTILVGYLLLVGRMPDIKRTFMYHGAEHKTINAFEAGVELTPENVALQTKVHPRCGTSFILTLVIFSVLIFSLLGPLPLHWRLISRILMLPVVAGIAYEYIRWAAKMMDKSAFVRTIIKPNLLLQRLTTKEPTIEMLEVAIAAFNRMFALEHETAEA
ncbi:MAG TPA: DUF1385 domain-containing protein [Anaerolineaceae bacterium]|mgnify:CR=1 FL=1|jgi:uncharacterized protein YqhQ|nr:DUF1385 domain-containing protein [Anaerolineaceae bacterium]NMD27678.1 DUF1385 domain-containing protein [Chloroflexota bacterium]HOA20891.1 DUF1385 domain-containing protein [Anaerolineaceae bacterium]